MIDLTPACEPGWWWNPQNIISIWWYLPLNLHYYITIIYYYVIYYLWNYIGKPPEICPLNSHRTPIFRSKLLSPYSRNHSLASSNRFYPRCHCRPTTRVAKNRDILPPEDMVKTWVHPCSPIKIGTWPTKTWEVDEENWGSTLNLVEPRWHADSPRKNWRCLWKKWRHISCIGASFAWRLPPHPILQLHSFHACEAGPRQLFKDKVLIQQPQQGTEHVVDQRRWGDSCLRNHHCSLPGFTQWDDRNNQRWS